MPDQRFKWLCDLYKPPSKVPAKLLVTDIAGLIKGASEGAGLGNAFLSHIQAVDGIYHCVRAFESDEVIHVDDSVDPVRDLETIQSELCKKDLAYVKKQIQAQETAKQGQKAPTIRVASPARQIVATSREGRRSWRADSEIADFKVPSA